MKTRTLVVFALLIGLCSLAFPQAQTGSIRGYVVDDKGQALPGVPVTISSPKMMGNQTFVSADTGEFRFPSCPPGEYTIRAELAGFQTLEKKSVYVRVGVTVDVTMEMTMSAQAVEISVTAETPVVDTKSTKTAFSITSDMIANIPMDRDIYDIVKHAPSVVEEGGGADFRKMVSIHGGTVQQTTYSMDGVSLSDPTRGYISKGVAFDAIEEIEMLTGGISAELGGMAGGFINVVSKSGGNKLSGSASFQYNGEGLSQSTLPEDQSASFGIPTVIFDKLYMDTSMTFGGPILKDRLWFFTNYQFGQQTRATAFIPFTDPRGIFHDTYDAKRKSWSIFGKLSAQISSKLKFMGMWQFMDSKEDPNFNQVGSKGAFATLEAMNRQLDNSHTVSTVLTYLVNQNMFAELRGGFVYHFQDVPAYSEARGETLAAITDRATGQRWGSYGSQELHHRYKWNAGLTVTRFLDNFLGGSHELKLGAEYGFWNTEDDRGVSFNPHSIGYFNGTPWYYHDTRPYVGRITLSTTVPRGGMADLNECVRFSAFVQDNLGVGKRLTLNLGLRFDKEWASRPEEIRKGLVDPNYNGLSNVLLPELFNTQDMIAPALKNFMVLTLFQPRIGLSFDVFGNGKTALKASFASYYDQILAANYGSVHPFRQSVTFLWNDLNQDGVLDLPPTDTYSATSIPRLIIDPEEQIKTVDPNIKAPNVNEFIVGIHHELVRDFSVSLQAIYKDGKNIIEQLDLANPLDGDMWLPYTVREPGDDQKLGTGDDRDLTVFALKTTAESPYLYRTNPPEAKRRYLGLELTTVKRMSHNWMFSGTVIYSKQYGNIGSGVYDSQGVRGYFTDPNKLIYRDGRQNWDRPLQIKLMTTIVLPFGINASAYFRYMSGAPMSEGGASGGQAPFNRTVTVYFPSTVNGFAVKVPSVSVFAEPAGSKRNSPTSSLDLRLEKTFHIWKGTLGLMIDGFNVLGSYRLNLSQDPGGYIYADGRFSKWPTFGKVLSAEGSRVVKLSVRYAFGR